MAVKVINVEDFETNTKRTYGFTYQTLKGHVEEGVATFTIVQDLTKHGQMSFTIESHSQSGNFLSKAMGRLSSRIQRQSTQAALKNFSRE